MTLEAILEEKAVLIFCPTKAETEKYAVALARYIFYCIGKGDETRFNKLSSLLLSSHQRQIVEYFSQKTFCNDNNLLNCIANGVAFHHAGIFLNFS